MSSLFLTFISSDAVFRFLTPLVSRHQAPALICPLPWCLYAFDLATPTLPRTCVSDPISDP